jgi:hypothetical protein
MLIRRKVIVSCPGRLVGWAGCTNEFELTRVISLGASRLVCDRPVPRCYAVRNRSLISKKKKKSSEESPPSRSSTFTTSGSVVTTSSRIAAASARALHARAAHLFGWTDRLRTALHACPCTQQRHSTRSPGATIHIQEVWAGTFRDMGWAPLGVWP